MQNLLAYTKGLSIKLQGRYSDVSRAHREIELVKKNVQDICTKIEVFHNRIYKQAVLMAQSVGIEETKPRIAGKQHHRRNIQAESCTDYYGLNQTIPLVDHLLSELTARFDDESSKRVVDFMHLLPSMISFLESPAHRQDFYDLAEFYEADLPCCVSFESELDMWKRKRRKNLSLLAH